MSNAISLVESPPEVADLAARTVDYVDAALGVTIAFDSETLPILDHYLKTVPQDANEAVDLIAACAGAYFGEVVRRRLGGNWDTVLPEALEWRLELPGGMWFYPAHVVLAAIHQSDDFQDNLNPPAKMIDAAEQALGRMSNVTESDYYSLCGRFDTLEHLQAVLLAIAADEAERRREAN